MLVVEDRKPRIRLGLPIFVCAAHRENKLAPTLITPRVLKWIGEMLRERGRRMPPWSKATLDFEYVG